MALNPQLNPKTHIPLRMEGEYFILLRSDCEFELITQKIGNLTSKGSLLLTTNRLILINKDYSNLSFNSCEFPLTSIYKENYSQPLIGRNKIEGICNPVFASLLGRVSFTIWFSNNHCGTVVSAFFILIDSFRRNQNRKLGEDIIQSIESCQFNNTFPIDPDDPAIFYQVQPEEFPLPKAVSQSVIQNRNNSNNMFLNNYQNQNMINSMMPGYRNNYENNNMKQMQFQNNNNDCNNIKKSMFVYKEPEKYIYKDGRFNYNFINQSNNNSENNDKY